MIGSSRDGCAPCDRPPERLGRGRAAPISPFAPSRDRDVRQRDLDVLERIAVGAARRGVAQALHRRPRRCAAAAAPPSGQRLLELHARAARPRLCTVHVASPKIVCSFMSRSNIGVALALAEHGLAIDDLRLAGARLHAVLALHAVDDDLEVELAHAAR